MTWRDTHVCVIGFGSKQGLRCDTWVYFFSNPRSPAHQTPWVWISYLGRVVFTVVLGGGGGGAPSLAIPVPFWPPDWPPIALWYAAQLFAKLVNQSKCPPMGGALRRGEPAEASQWPSALRPQSPSPCPPPYTQRLFWGRGYGNAEHGDSPPPGWSAQVVLPS